MFPQAQSYVIAPGKTRETNILSIINPYFAIVSAGISPALHYAPATMLLASLTHPQTVALTSLLFPLWPDLVIEQHFKVSLWLAFCSLT